MCSTVTTTRAAKASTPRNTLSRSVQKTGRVSHNRMCELESIVCARDIESALRRAAFLGEKPA